MPTRKCDQRTSTTNPAMAVDMKNECSSGKRLSRQRTNL